MAIVQNPIPIPEPINEVDALWRTTQALKEAVEVIQGIRGNREAALLTDLEATTTIVNNITGGGVPGITTLAALIDTDLTGQAQYDLIYNADGVNWEDTAGLLQWDGTALQLANDLAIDWLNQTSNPVELLRFLNAPPTGDPCWADVLYLAKWEGADAATAYTELKQSDVQNFYGNAQLDTAQFNYGAASLLLDGTADGVQSTGDSIFGLGTEDEATVDGFVRFASLPSGAGVDVQLVNQAQQDVNNFEVRFGDLNGAGLYQVEARFGFGNTPTGVMSAPTLDVWYYFAAQRRIDGANHYVDIFFGLVSGGTASRVSQTLSNNNPSQSIGGVPITVGAWDNTSNQTFTQVLDGHLDDVRLTKCARYGNVGSVTIPSDYPLFGTAASDVFTVGDPGYVTNIEGSEVQINGVPLETNATHTGEVTGDVALTLDVTAITNRTDVVADSADDVAIHDDSDGSLKKVNLSSITDAGYF